MSQLKLAEETCIVDGPDSDTRTICVDLQQTLLVPCLQVSSVYYKRNMALYYLCIYELNLKLAPFLCAKCISCSLSPPLVSSSVWLLLSVMKKRVTDKVRLALCQWLVVDWTCHISCLFLGVVVVEDGGGVGWL